MHITAYMSLSDNLSSHWICQKLHQYRTLISRSFATNIFLGKLKEVYINGGFLSRTTVELTIPRVTFTSESDLIFGAGYFYALENEYWNMHIDDFGIWTDHFFTSDDVLYIMSKGSLLYNRVYLSVTCILFAIGNRCNIWAWVGPSLERQDRREGNFLSHSL